MMNIAELFDQAAESYDATRKKYIPCIADLYGVLVEQIPYNARDKFSVLDLGAGTGLLTSVVRKSFPAAEYTLIDFSSEMLEKARERFAGENGITYQIVDFDSQDIPDSYDIVISALALHHLPLDRLYSVFRKIFDLLKPGGIFVNADQILGETPQIEKVYEQTWLRHAQAAGCTQREIEVALERMKADMTSTLKDQLAGLKKASFQNVNCWYQFYRYATYSGTKA
jgi:tRNA (cmo5U34)-methyltransferase